MRAKVQNKKQNHKILLVVITILGTMGVLLWSLWNFTQSAYFPINHIKVFATYEHLNQNTLQKIIFPYTKSGFFYLNVRGMKQQLLKFPWIHAVSVKRQWPDTITINIVEQNPTLQWGEKALVNSEGTIFSPPLATFPKKLPIIFGPSNQVLEICTLYQKTVPLLERLDLTIKKLVLNPEHYWKILLSNNTIIYLKEKEPLNQIELLGKVYKKITTNHKQPPKSIDLRYQSGLAVKWE